MSLNELQAVLYKSIFSLYFCYSMLVSIIPFSPVTAHSQTAIGLTGDKESRSKDKQLDLFLMFYLFFSIFIFNSSVTEAQRLEPSILCKLGIVHPVRNWATPRTMRGACFAAVWAGCSQPVWCSVCGGMQQTAAPVPALLIPHRSREDLRHLFTQRNL